MLVGGVQLMINTTPQALRTNSSSLGLCAQKHAPPRCAAVAKGGL